jgi:hypothetical protein
MRSAPFLIPATAGRLRRLNSAFLIPHLTPPVVTWRTCSESSAYIHEHRTTCPPKPATRGSYQTNPNIWRRLDHPLPWQRAADQISRVQK